MSFFFEETSKEVYEELHNGQYDGSPSQEVIAGAASFEAARIFENSQRKEGKPISHDLAKELLAALASTEVEKIYKARSLDRTDCLEAKCRAQNYVRRNYDEHYGQYDQWDPKHKAQFDYNYH